MLSGSDEVSACKVAAVFHTCRLAVALCKQVSHVHALSHANNRPEAGCGCLNNWVSTVANSQHDAEPVQLNSDQTTWWSAAPNGWMALQVTFRSGLVTEVQDTGTCPT